MLSRLINDDCFNILPDLYSESINLILTDPPYAISRDTGIANTKLDKYKDFSMDFGEWDKTEIDLTGFFVECHRILKKSGTAICFYDWKKITNVIDAMEVAGFKMIRLIIWEKSNPVPINQSSTYLSNCREVAIVGVKGGKPTFHGKYDNGVYSHPIPAFKGGRIHPTQKSTALIRDLIEKHSNKGDWILDAFMGSGEIPLNAKKLGREYIGIEIDSNMFDKASERFFDVNDLFNQ